MEGAFKTGKYRNVFAELGYDKEEIEKRKEEFDRLWKWTKTFMFMQEGIHSGYYAWSCDLNGRKNYNGPAPNGEEYFAMALIFASHR